ncbi:FecR family protein [Tunicatimonas pelagia]|uniref:FecR family protein n=1 Tax=Tunicatimonas pelagia TaxID=931531 RepID=UPI002664E634|nr:FecR domain-containing protein [Tunicatimonas pelagia]WKN41492.1 FecR domain-containing protein [Tunicatimonas pelagia]
MGKPNDDIWTLVAKQVTGELTKEEAEQLADWQQKRPENEATVEQVKELWRESKQGEPFYEPDIEEGWQRFLFRSEQQTVSYSAGTGTTRQSKLRSLVWWPGVAASITLLLALSWLWYNRSPEANWQEFAVVNGETTQLTLPDSSQVWLNSNSTLRYADNFNVENRIVYLEGEAFFDVKQAEGRRFTIFSEGAKTEVIGTSFNLEAYPKMPVAVQVVSGRVAFSSTNEDDAVFLEPGEEAVLTEHTAIVQKREISNPNFRAWQNNVLTFNNTDLQQIAHQMEEHFGITINLAEPALANCRYTATFEGATPESVLTTLSAIGNLSYQQQGKQYTLSGAGCQK